MMNSAIILKQRSERISSLRSQLSGANGTLYNTSKVSYKSEKAGTNKHSWYGATEPNGEAQTFSHSDPWDIGTDEDTSNQHKTNSDSLDILEKRTQNDLFPLEPDTVPKRIWDIICMLLLVYCSFSVPYSIAFINSDSSSGHLSDIDFSDLAIDLVFMLDIALTFVTQFENQGVMEKNLAIIARHYLESWFFPDLAGSFPFDIVIAAAMGSAGNLSAMKLIRMVRLIRAAKFLSKLHKLKQKEGMEAFGPAIGIFSAIFILIFSAHFLGCFFMLLAGTETGVTWLSHYDPDLEYADNFTRYIVALYWAVISLTTMGYGDVVPASHIERIFAVGVALVGAIVFAHCVGTISSLITQVILF